MPSGVSYWKYVHEISMFSSLKKGKSPRTSLRFAAGSLATELIRMNMKLDAVELDSRMMPIARDYFYFDDTTTNFIVDDAAPLPQKRPAAKYDSSCSTFSTAKCSPLRVYLRELSPSSKPSQRRWNDRHRISGSSREKEKPQVYKCIVNPCSRRVYKAVCPSGEKPARLWTSSSSPRRRKSISPC